MFLKPHSPISNNSSAGNLREDFELLLRARQAEFVSRALAALSERGNTLAVAPSTFGKTVALAAIDKIMRK